MKKKQKDTYRSSSIVDLQKKIDEVESQLAKVSIDRYTKQTKNTRQARNLKRQIAVLKTYVQEKKIMEEQPS